MHKNRAISGLKTPPLQWWWKFGYHNNTREESKKMIKTHLMTNVFLI